ncbi:hypothetical protein A3K73_00460 [Candidatus Pacearchaeota archaeon RBG_13_36_9]|nr:MAG: hypothetical protein A3K73_00460 [Candidatus Pacearchaeota archaeon RBG_13_36_9]
MRIKIGKQKIFFEEILRYRKTNLKELAKALKINYSPLKRYNRGELTIPLEVFKKLIKLSPRKEYWMSKINNLEDNWGSVKGGNISVKTGDMSKRMEHARKFRKIKKVKIKMDKFFCEFYGLLLGDGCISKFKAGKHEKYGIFISGNKRLDSAYLREMKKRIEGNYGIYVYYYESKKVNVCTLTIRNKGLCLELNKNLGFPIGIKYDSIKIPDKILKLKWDDKKFLLRGLLDSDGSIYAKKNEEYRYPIINIRSKNKKFLEEIYSLLKEQNYPAYFSDWNVSIRGIKNINRWFEDIGSSNSRNTLKYQYFLKHKNLPPKVTQGPVL